MLLARGRGIRHFRSSAQSQTFRSKAGGGQDAHGHPARVGSSSSGSGQSLPGQEGATDPPRLSPPHSLSAPGLHTSVCDGWCVIRRQQQAGDGQSSSQHRVGYWLLFAREGHRSWEQHFCSCVIRHQRSEMSQPELSEGLKDKCMDVQGSQGLPLTSPQGAVEGSLLARYSHTWRQWSRLS